jgi:hypothetical protein
LTTNTEEANEHYVYYSPCTPQNYKFKSLDDLKFYLETTSLTRNCIKTSDVARILHDKTSLGDNWTILKRVLEISPGKWAEISGKYPHQASLLDTIESLLQTWSASKGFDGATVGRLYHQFKEQDYQVAGGSKLN